MARAFKTWTAGITDRRTDAVWYVAQVPGEGGVCWGWTDDPAKARPLTIGWLARFRRAALELRWRAPFFRANAPADDSEEAA